MSFFFLFILEFFYYSRKILSHTNNSSHLVFQEVPSKVLPAKLKFEIYININININTHTHIYTISRFICEVGGWWGVVSTNHLHMWDVKTSEIPVSQQTYGVDTECGPWWGIAPRRHLFLSLTWWPWVIYFNSRRPYILICKMWITWHIS